MILQASISIQISIKCFAGEAVGCNLLVHRAGGNIDIVLTNIKLHPEFRSVSVKTVFSISVFIKRVSLCLFQSFDLVIRLNTNWLSLQPPSSQNVSVLSTEFWIHQCTSLALHCLVTLHLLQTISFLLSKPEPNSQMNCPAWYWQVSCEGLKDCKYQLVASWRLAGAHAEAEQNWSLLSLVCRSASLLII